MKTTTHTLLQSLDLAHMPLKMTQTEKEEILALKGNLLDPICMLLAAQ